ncbi:AAA family ATPase [uncultured Stenotrophomonas sp.]|uniref:AAA family ATPase n=1 Tax=uncultured Stenotrophomonas sp. TaxID=165438 RepID=UPI0025F9C7E1|nr:AAA family ATPase [uncultured Stenotrophomonas sp.]
MTASMLDSRQRFLHDMQRALRGGHPGVVVTTRENARLDGLLAELASTLGLKLIEWNSAFGEVDPRSKLPRLEVDEALPDLREALRELMATSLTGRLIVVADAGMSLASHPRAVPALAQMLQRVAKLAAGSSLVVLVTPDGELPQAGQLPVLPHVRLHAPGEQEITRLVAEEFERHGKAEEEPLAAPLRQACMGLGESSVRALLAQAALDEPREARQVLRDVNREKAALIAGSSPLQVVSPIEESATIGGLEQLRGWLKQRGEVFADRAGAAKLRVRLPKGVLIAGMPGCGKSLTAKLTAKEFNLPLLKLDVGRLMGRYVGDSEANMRSALATAEDMSPCILWMDELEKAFSGLGTGQASEVSTRLVGYLLTWMQENTQPVFVVATANDVTKLPPELLRKGRFDEVFYVDFPNQGERRAILDIHLGMEEDIISGAERDALSKQMRDFSGADIEMAVSEARLQAFIAKEPLATYHIQIAVHDTVPLGQTLAEQIQKSQEKFSTLKLRPASEPAADGMTLVRLREMANGNDKQRILAGGHGDAPNDVLEKLGRDDSETVSMTVLRHPHCPQKVLSYWLEMDEGNKRFKTELFQAAALHMDAPSELLAELIRSRDKRIDEKLAAKMQALPHCAGGVLETLMDLRTDDQWRRAILKHPNCPPAVLQRFAESMDIPTRAAAASHASIPDVTRSMLLKSDDVFVLTALSANIACSPEERAFCLQMVHAHGILRDATSSLFFDEVMGQPGPLHERIQRLLARSKDKEVLGALAARVDLVEEVQLQLADNSELIDVLAANPTLRPKVQKKLLTAAASETETETTDGSDVFGQIVASMTSSFGLAGVVLSAVNLYMRDGVAQKKAARLLAASPVLEESLIGNVASIGDDETRVLIATRESLPTEWAEWLAHTHPTPAVLKALSRNVTVAGSFNQGFADLTITACNGVERLEMIEAGALPKAVIQTLSNSIGDAEVQDVLAEIARWEGLLKTVPDQGGVDAQKRKKHVLQLRALRDRAYVLAQENAALSDRVQPQCFG